MAVDVTYLNSNSTTNIDTNFERTKEALEKALGREGDLPNHMETDLDMNGNDILNVDTIQVQDITIDGDNATGILERALEAATEAEEAATEATLQADRAEDEADRAEGYANGLNLPSANPGDTNKQLHVNLAEDGYDLNPNSVRATFHTVQDLLNDNTLDYTKVTIGEEIIAQGFRYEVAASNASDAQLTNSGGVKLYVLPLSDGGGTPEQFNGGSGADDNSEAVTACLAAFGKITFRKGQNYTFTNAVEITANALIDLNGASVTFGDGHLNLFHVTAPIDDLRIINCAGVTLQDVETYTLKNFVSNYAIDGGTIIGFPTGEVSDVKRFYMDNCSVASSRVFVKASEKFSVIESQFVDEDYIVRPASILCTGTGFATIERNKLKAEYHEDAIKGGSVGGRITGNSVEHIGATGHGQVDIYSSLGDVNITGNWLKNIQIHRKQTGGEGAAVDLGFNVIAHNTFVYDRGGQAMIYYRGSQALINSNTFRVEKSDSAGVLAIQIDDEAEIYDDGDTDWSGLLSIVGNLCDFTKSSDQNGTIFITRESGEIGDDSSVPITAVGNTVRGGVRFTNGKLDVLSGNT